MYICLECGETFEVPKVHYEHHPYGMGYAEEKWELCPHCGEAGFEIATMCNRCFEYVAHTTKGLCDECYNEVYGEEGEE